MQRLTRAVAEAARRAGRGSQRWRRWHRPRQRHLASCLCTAPASAASSSTAAPGEGDGAGGLATLLSAFPPVSYAFAYGSGVFQQANHARTQDNMLDVVLAVEAAREWHTANMARNPGHYSSLRWLGPRAVAAVQRWDAGAKVYYNTNVSVNGQFMKYGVIEVGDLRSDLDHWDSLYVSGRLHKPVLELCACPGLATSQHANQRAAACAALLQLPAETDELSLFLAIANLSYGGDPRMAFAEAPDKVRNIVQGNLSGFRELYGPVLAEVGAVVDGQVVVRGDSASAVQALVDGLPSGVMSRLPASTARPSPDDVRQATAAIVAAASTAQSAKGLVTAGLSRSLVYAAAKLRKALAARRRTA